MVRHTTLYSLVSASMLAWACNGELKDQLGDHPKKSSAARTKEQVAMALVVERQPTGDGFALDTLTTDDFVIDVTSCSSGYSTTVTSTTLAPVDTVSLYKYDTDCRAELSQFEWAGATWTKQGGGTLSSGSAIFTDGAGTEVNVTVFQSLASTLVDGGSAVFVFQEILRGADFVVSNYTFSETLEVQGIEAPNVTIRSVDLTAIASGSGVPTFTVEIECGVATVANSCPTPSGIEQDMRNYKIAVVYDDPVAYNGTLSYSQAQDIIDDNGIAIVVANIGAIGANGGFSKSVDSDSGPLFTKRNLLIVIEFADPIVVGAKSYRYFNADIGTP